MLVEAKFVTLDIRYMELSEDSSNVMTAAEMQERTEEILKKMAEKGISDKKLRKTVGKEKEDAMNNGRPSPVIMSRLPPKAC